LRRRRVAAAGFAKSRPNEPASVTPERRPLPAQRTPAWRARTRAAGETTSAPRPPRWEKIWAAARPSPASLRSPPSPAVRAVRERGYETFGTKLLSRTPRERGDQAPTGPRGARPEDRLRAWWVRVAPLQQLAIIILGRWKRATADSTLCSSGRVYVPQEALSSILLALAASAFGRTSCKTPSLRVASMRSRSMFSDRVKTRS